MWQLIPIPLNKDVFFSTDYGGKHLIRPTEYDISFWEWYKMLSEILLSSFKY